MRIVAFKKFNRHGWNVRKVSISNRNRDRMIFFFFLVIIARCKTLQYLENISAIFQEKKNKNKT